MKSRLLQSARWVLIVLFSACLLYLAYAAIVSLVPPVLRGEADFGFIGSVLVTLFISGLLGLFPAIMLYSLLTKRLYGFASSIGAIAALALFYLASSLSSSKELMGFIDYWLVTSPSDGGLPKIMLALAIAFGLLILPYWVLVRTIRLTNEWVYPKLFKPLEDRI